MKLGRTLAAIAMLGVLAVAWPGLAQQGSLPSSLWQVYKERFLDESGRIVDNANGGISHSEGQGYGLALAFMADSPADFEQIWSFTKTELMVRDDGLAAWKWDPSATPKITDLNNASDGDLLIAYALALAGSAWDRRDYLQSAAQLARDILEHAVVERGGRTILLPAVEGFDTGQRADGPVINPSYWIFEAFPVMALLAPSDKWTKLSRDGEALLESLKFGPRDLPAEWVSLARQPRPAEGFPAEFGYNSIRIPLYLMRSNTNSKALMTRLLKSMTLPEGELAVFNLSDGSPKETLADPGYQFINHILACVNEGTKIPEHARELTSEFYYPATLHLLGLAYVVEKHPSCL